MGRRAVSGDLLRAFKYADADVVDAGEDSEEATELERCKARNADLRDKVAFEQHLGHQAFRAGYDVGIRAARSEKPE